MKKNKPPGVWHILSVFPKIMLALLVFSTAGSLVAAANPPDPGVSTDMATTITDLETNVPVPDTPLALSLTLTGSESVPPAFEYGGMDIKPADYGKEAIKEIAFNNRTVSDSYDITSSPAADLDAANPRDPGRD